MNSIGRVIVAFPIYGANGIDRYGMYVLSWL